MTDDMSCDEIGEELQRVRFETELILGAAGEEIYGLGKDGKATFANEASTRILGWDAIECANCHRHWIDLLTFEPSGNGLSGARQSAFLNDE